MLPIIDLLAFNLHCFILTVEILEKIMIGLLYTYIGLVLFNGVNRFISALGRTGAALSSGKVRWLVPLAMAIGWFIILEPAVAVLEKQIETVSRC